MNSQVPAARHAAELKVLIDVDGGGRRVRRLLPVILNTVCIQSAAQHGMARRVDATSPPAMISKQQAHAESGLLSP